MPNNKTNECSAGRSPVKRLAGRRLLNGVLPLFQKLIQKQILACFSLLFPVSNFFCLLGLCPPAGGPPLTGQRAASCLRGSPASPCLIGLASCLFFFTSWGTPVNQPAGRQLLITGFPPSVFKSCLGLSNWLFLLGFLPPRLGDPR